MNQNKVHCIGIGGIGISSLARHYLKEGWQVSGSDLVASENSRKLEADGATIVYEQSPANITDNIDLVVYSDGVTEDTTGWGELDAARAAGIETISYFEALARVANEYYLIAVAGTHGKTTTTAMLADILEEASYDPTVFVGSLRSKTGTNYRRGQSKYCVVEADEYLRHFLYFTPDVVIINNLDLDHPEYFKDLADVQDAFKELVAKVPEDGFVVANTADPHVVPVLESAVATVVDYRQHLNLERHLLQPGLHNRQNAAAAEAAATAIGVEAPFSDTALKNFIGTARRFEYKGEVHHALTQGPAGNAPVYDDYAHNPQNVAAAIAGAREVHPNKKLTVVFQSHTYSRTKTLFAEFIDALATADRVILLPIFAAREVDDGSVSSEMIHDALVERGVESSVFHTHEAAALEVRETVGSDDVVVCVGAGSVTKVSELLTT
jgi:UDP-N-acetylmuramate--alanine ligase